MIPENFPNILRDKTIQRWYSNAKLMITAEYVVLYGAKALAMPLKYGQSLEVSQENSLEQLHFSTEVCGKPWFEARFIMPSLEIANSSDPSIAGYLQQILLAARELNPQFLKQHRAISARAIVNFKIDWGIGSSSSLISNIAWWADVNPYKLNRIISKGSGYDIACARQNTALYYSIHSEKPLVEPVSFNPLFKNQLWFVYQGNKKATEADLSANISILRPTNADIQEISGISELLVRTTNVKEVFTLLERHEVIISRLLNRPTIQSLYFSDFRGIIKSLGAWGGDFCMVVSEESESYVKEYFEQKKLLDVLSFNEVQLTTYGNT